MDLTTGHKFYELRRIELGPDARPMNRKTLRRDDRGLAAIEYAILGGIVGLGIVTALVTTKGSLNRAYGCIASSVGGSASVCAPAASAPIPSDPTLAAAQAQLPAGIAVTSVAGNATTPAYTVGLRTMANGTMRVTAVDPIQKVQYVMTLVSTGENYYEVTGGTDYTGAALFNTLPGEAVYAIKAVDGTYGFYTVKKPSV